MADDNYNYDLNNKSNILYPKYKQFYLNFR